MPQYNENIRIAAPNPLDRRSLSERLHQGSQLPFIDTDEVNSTIIPSVRHSGLTVNIQGTEYWYRYGVGDNDLVKKTVDLDDIEGDFITGATNVGYFSGTTSVQTLNINKVGGGDYVGNYASIYNYYYRDTEGYIRVGRASDNIYRRGYVKTTAPVKSWIWNEYIGSSNLVGWIHIDGDVRDQIGTFQPGITYYTGIGASLPHTVNEWTEGQFYSNGSLVQINSVTGNLTSGDPITIGGPFYIGRRGTDLEFRTLKSRDDSSISITHDGAFIYLSGATVGGTNVGTGSPILKGVTGSTVYVRTVRGINGATVTQEGDEVIISTATGGDSLVAGDGIQITDNIIEVINRVPTSTFNSYLPVLNSAITGGTNGISTIGLRELGLGGNLVDDVEIVGVDHNFHINANNIRLQGLGGIDIIDTEGEDGINIESDTGVIRIAGNNTLSNPKVVLEISETELTITDSRSTPVGAEYDDDYSAYYTNRSLVDREYVDRTKNVVSVINVDSPYTAVSTDYFIGAIGGLTITLMISPVTGQKLLISNTNGNALTNPITIQGNGKLINGSSSASIDTNHGSISLIYNGTAWSVVGFAS